MEPIERTNLTIYAEGFIPAGEHIVPLLSVHQLDSDRAKRLPVLAQCMEQLVPALDKYNERAYGLIEAWHSKDPRMVELIPTAIDQLTTEVRNLQRMTMDLHDSAASGGQLSLEVDELLNDVTQVCMYAEADVLRVAEELRIWTERRQFGEGDVGSEPVYGTDSHSGVDTLGTDKLNDEGDGEGVATQTLGFTLTVSVADLNLMDKVVYNDLDSLKVAMEDVVGGDGGLDILLLRYVEEGGMLEPNPRRIQGPFFSWDYSVTDTVDIRAMLVEQALAKWNREVLTRVAGDGAPCNYFELVDRAVFFYQLEDLDSELRLLRTAMRALDTGATELTKVEPTAGVGTIRREHHTGPHRDIFYVTASGDDHVFDRVKSGIKKKYSRYTVLPEAVQRGGAPDVEPAVGGRPLDRPLAGGGLVGREEPCPLFNLERLATPVRAETQKAVVAYNTAAARYNSGRQDKDSGQALAKLVLDVLRMLDREKPQEGVVQLGEAAQATLVMLTSERPKGKDRDKGEGERPLDRQVAGGGLVGREEPCPLFNLEHLAKPVRAETRKAVVAYNTAAERYNSGRQDKDSGQALAKLVLDVLRMLSVERPQEGMVQLGEAAQATYTLLIGERQKGKGRYEPSDVSVSGSESGSGSGSRSKGLIFTVEFPGGPAKLEYDDVGRLVSHLKVLGLEDITTRHGLPTALGEYNTFVSTGYKSRDVRAAGNYFSWLWHHDAETDIHNVTAELQGDVLAAWNETVLRELDGGAKCGYFVAGSSAVIFRRPEDLDPELCLLQMAALAKGAGTLSKPDTAEGDGTIVRESRGRLRSDIFRVTSANGDSSGFQSVETAVKKVYSRHPVKPAADQG